MFDDLRNESRSSEFTDDELDSLLEPKKDKERKPLTLGSRGKVFGLTALQRFILSLLLVLSTCLLGSMLLLVTGKVIPF